MRVINRMALFMQGKFALLMKLFLASKFNYITVVDLAWFVITGFSEDSCKKL